MMRDGILTTHFSIITPMYQITVSTARKTVNTSRIGGLPTLCRREAMAFRIPIGITIGKMVREVT